MPPATVVYYVSGHGYGHARRSAEVIRSLRTVAPDANVYVRTSAPADLFTGLTAGPVVSSVIDPTVVESDPLTIDWSQTLGSAADVLRRRRAIVAKEVDAVRDLDPALVLADVPFLAGDVATALDRPCVAVSNFTWDWIFEPHRAAHPDGSAVLRGVRSSYASMTALLQMPFGHETDVFPQVIPVPLVARRSSREPEEVLRTLNLDPTDLRPRVLIGMRGGIPTDVLTRAAAAATDFLFLSTRPLDTPPARNLRHVDLPPSLDFSDLLVATDVVLSKLGYGMISECIAAGTRLLWPPRNGFREDEITAAEAPRYLRMLEMPPGDFRTGNWRASIERAMTLPPPPEQMDVTGAETCAKLIAGRWLSADM